METLQWTRVTRGANLRSKIIGQGHWEREYKKLFFCAYFRQSWIDLHESKTAMNNGRFYTYRRIHFTIAEMLRFHDICL